MIYIKWEDKYLLGIKELDDHHKHLFDLLNRSVTACMLNDPSGDLRAIASELSDYAHYHFSAEELVMEENEYPGLPEQKQEQEIFSGTMYGYMQKIENDELCSSVEMIELTEFMSNWLKDHILDLDSKLGKFLNK